MTSTRVTEIRDDLRVEESKVQAHLDSLRAEMKDTEVQLGQIRKAMSSLKGKASTVPAKSRVTATTEEVATTITEVLREKGTATEDVLKRLVEERLMAHGKSRVGLAMRFRKALKDERFVRTGGMFGLANSNELGQATVDRGG